MKPIALQMFTVRREAAIDYVGTLRKIAKIGYKGVETGLNLAKAKESRQTLDDVGLVASSCFAPLANRDNVNAIVEAAGIMGVKTLVNGKGPEQFTKLDDIKKVAEEFQLAAELLAPHGLKMAYHNHWWEMNVLDGRLGLEILYGLAPAMACEIDMYWAGNFGAVNVPPLVRKYRDRVPLLHVKDGPWIKDQPMTAAGKGKVPIADCVNAANPDVLEWVIFEMDECATDTLTAVADSYAFLTRAGLAEGEI
jgi:sugar phosphate isomerase/epimerase